MLKNLSHSVNSSRTVKFSSDLVPKLLQNKYVFSPRGPKPMLIPTPLAQHCPDLWRRLCGPGVVFLNSLQNLLHITEAL